MMRTMTLFFLFVVDLGAERRTPRSEPWHNRQNTSTDYSELGHTVVKLAACISRRKPAKRELTHGPC